MWFLTRAKALGDERPMILDLLFLGIKERANHQFTATPPHLSFSVYRSATEPSLARRPPRSPGGVTYT